MMKILWLISNTYAFLLLYKALIKKQKKRENEEPIHIWDSKFIVGV